MLRTHPKRHIEFDPAGMTLPRLVDEYDRSADAYLGDASTDLARTWRLAQVSPDPAPPPPYRARFGTVANWLQIPSITPEKEAEREKAAPLDDAELRDLHVRIELAKEWLERWAPEDAKFSVRPTMLIGALMMQACFEEHTYTPAPTPVQKCGDFKYF